MEDQEQVPPSSFERQLTPEEEKAVLINFMGNTYGEVKKLDSNVVGNSTSLGNRSDGIKQHLEHVVKSNAANTPVNTLPVQAQPVQQPVHLEELILILLMAQSQLLISTPQVAHIPAVAVMITVVRRLL